MYCFEGFVTKRFEIHGYPGSNLHAVLALLVRDQPGGSVCHGMVEWVIVHGYPMYAVYNVYDTN